MKSGFPFGSRSPRHGSVRLDARNAVAAGRSKARPQPKAHPSVEVAPRARHPTDSRPFRARFIGARRSRRSTGSHGPGDDGRARRRQPPGVRGGRACRSSPGFQRCSRPWRPIPALVASDQRHYVPVLIDGDASREIGLLTADLCAEINAACSCRLFVWMTPEGNPVAWIPVATAAAATWRTCSTSPTHGLPDVAG